MNSLLLQELEKVLKSYFDNTNTNVHLRSFGLLCGSAWLFASASDERCYHEEAFGHDSGHFVFTIHPSNINDIMEKQIGKEETKTMMISEQTNIPSVNKPSLISQSC